MRRPHPRFDASRNAWVTNAGGKLQPFAKGPKTADTEQEAWNAFYEPTARLGRPVDAAQPQITLGGLADEYGAWMEKEVRANRMEQKTLGYYQHHLQKFLDAVGGNRDAMSVLPIEVERYKTNWHSVQTGQRLYNWERKWG
jgi:hypothetical protein